MEFDQKKDTELKLAVYKLLSDSFYVQNFTKDIIQFFIRKIIDIEPASICTEDIELLQEIGKSTYKGVDMQDDVRSFYWKIIERSDEIQPNIVEIVIKAYSDTFSNDQQKESKQQVLESFKVIVENIRIFKNELKQKFGNVNITEQMLEQTNSIKPSYIDQIKSRIEFLNFVYNILPNDIMLTFEIICSVWDAVVIEGLMQKEKELIYTWFSEINTVNNIGINNNNNNSGLSIKHEDLKQFFYVKLSSKEGLDSLTPEGFNCFKSVFCIINETEGKMRKFLNKNSPVCYNNYGKSILYSYSNYNCNNNEEDQRNNLEFDYIMCDNPEQLIGNEELWKIILENENIELVKKSLNFLNNLHTNFDSNKINQEEEELIKSQYYEKVYKYLQENKEEQKKIEKCLLILESILDESEKKGNGGLKSLLCLSRGELLTFHCTAQFYIQDAANQFTVKIYSNDSLTDLLYQIGLMIKCSWEEVQLYLVDQKMDLLAKDNGRSINELKIKNGSKILVSKKRAPAVKEAALVLENQEINPLAIQIFREWFKQFAKDGKMKAEEIAQFTNSCTNDNCLPTDRRIVACLQQYDKDSKGYLLEDNFVEFYSQACRTKPDIVRKNLESYHYRRDLKRYDEIGIEQISVEKLPRYILSQNEEFFQLLFQLLDKQEISSNVWKLLSRLPINPSLFQKLRQCENWESFLDSSSVYKLMYNLHLMEYLMDYQGKDSNNNNWAFGFIKSGGFNNLFMKFQKLQLNIIQSNSFEKYMFSFILKMFQKYLVAAFQSVNNEINIYKMVGIMSLGHLSLPSLILLIRKNKREEKSQLLRKESEIKDQLLENEARKFEALEEDQQDKGNSHEKIYNEVKPQLEQGDDFIELVKNIKEQKLNEIILQKFDFDELVDQLCQLCIYFTTQVNADKLEIEDRTIIEYSFLLLGAIFLNNKDVCENFFVKKEEKFQKLLISCLFYRYNQNIRKNFNNFIYVLAAQKHHFLIKLILKILKKQLQNVTQEENAQTSTQYFELFCSLLDSLHEKQEKRGDFDFPLLLKEVTQILISHKTTENSRLKNKNEKVLIGLINLSDRIVNILDVKEKEIHGKVLINEIFNKCLFDKNLKCKGEQSRISSYQLLKSLCKDCPSNLNILIQDGLANILQKLPNYNLNIRAREIRSECGYVGIYNLGCICYMNAMLQQFYMVPTFRYGILMANDGKEQNIVQTEYNKKQIQCDDNVFHQLQQMFAFLELSDRIDYNPLEFCFSFKDYSGEPVNTIIQQDAQEFLNMIFDKVENALKGGPFEKILEGVFGGKTCSQLQCLNCGHKKRNFEKFFNLSLEVKNMKNLNESLDKFILGETISDFQCENCQKKVDVIKNIHLSKLPNVLILHLQRIIFDLDSMQNIKLNSKLEFPHLLNLKPYMMNDLLSEESDFEYELAGVVVHTGTADSGHYYSYIDTNRGEFYGDRTNDAWVEFNDSRIKEFSAKNIENECFGGQSGDQDDGNSFGGNIGVSFNLFRGKDNYKSAYILVYEKKIKKELELIFEKEEDLKGFNFVRKVQQQEGGKISSFVNFYEFQEFKDKLLINNDNNNNSGLFQKVINDNNTFMLEKNIYNDIFYNFVKDVLSQIQLSDDLILNSDCEKDGYYVNYKDIQEEKKQENINLIDIHTKVIFDLFQKSSDQQIMQEMTKRLKILLKLTPEYVYEFFIKNIQPRALQGDIIKSQEQQTREFLSEIYSLCIQIIINFNDLNILNHEEDQQKQIMANNLVNFLNLNIEFLHDLAQKHLNKIEEFFQFWGNFVLCGKQQLEFAFQNKFIHLFVDFFLMEASPLKYIRKKNIVNSNMRLETPPYNSLIKFILFILDKKYNTNHEKNTLKMDLCNDLKIAFFSNAFWERVFTSEKIEQHVLGNLLEKFAFKNQFCSEVISLAITSGLFRVTYDDSKPYANAIQYFLCIKDEYQQKRLEWVLGVPILCKNFTKIETMNNDIDDRKQIINLYGTYGMNSLLDSFYVFTSSLNHDQTKSVLELIHNTRKMQDNTCIQFVLAILNAANCDFQVLSYICLMPSPSCFFGKFVDLIFYFVFEYQDDSVKQKYSYFPKKTYADISVQSVLSFQKKMVQFYNNMGIQTDVFE
ncbi:ubiquitin carboxyl-terminal hydrolase family protein, putative, partial [Ichthyophthirius multifiliis]